ncbi:MAG: hypothetical protein GEU80_13600 [Dehalococcoidia bacterium]|nr:hypothetical protein [Dehalococcoidia bacterium]
MDRVLGVRFIEAGPITYCSPGDFDLGTGDYVVVRTDRGERLGWVVVTPDQVVAATIEGPLRVVDRIATEADVDVWRKQRERADGDVSRAQALAVRTDPRVRIASITYDLSGEHGELTFTAGERVDFDWLHRQFAELLDTDLYLQQVGDRDRAKAIGGLGLCGRALCCATWMTNFPQISIKMAKDQDLSPNPTKISGVCGRLLCCLSFEVEAYRELRGDLPKVGKRVSTPIGRAKVLSINALKQLVRLRMDATGEVIEIPAADLRAQYGSAVRPVELEERIEQPIRDQEHRLAANTIATLEPVEARTSTVRAARPLVAPTGELPDAAPNGAADDTGDASGEEAPRRRRRRGRRGGRRRRRPGDGGEQTGGTAPEE